MLNILLTLLFNKPLGFSSFVSSSGAYGYWTNYNFINKPNWTLNVGFSYIKYQNVSQNYMNFDFKYNKNGFSIQFIGSFPLNYNYVPSFR
jgi:heterodisulfide reductase subunit B